MSARFTAAPYCEDSPGEFITRFSEYFRSLNLKPLPNAEELVHLDSPSVVWYADAVDLRGSSETSDAMLFR